MPEFTLPESLNTLGRNWACRAGYGGSIADQPFAECSGDRQWIDVDVARAKRESPYRAPNCAWLPEPRACCAIADGVGAVPTDAGPAFNYGLDKVRFLAPVKAGDRVRLRVALVDVEQKSGGVLLKTE